MRKIIAIVFAACLCGCQGVRSPQPQQAGKGWLASARYGIFAHYLLSDEKYNEKADSFNVENFANQISQTGADYVIFTLGQNSGYYCGPNATYERLAGYQPGQRCTRRDLPMEIADALGKRGIRLMLYLPSRAPQEDKQAMAKLGDTPQNEPAPQDFIRNWSAVIEEWSARYGRKVSGWWFDGTYVESSWSDLTKPYNFHTWVSACRAGNPDSALAFNKGTENTAFWRLSDRQDYTAGEMVRFGATPESNPPFPGVRWHILSYLGDYWGKPSGPNYTADWMIGYIQRVNRQGGMVSMDVNVSWDGTIYEPHLELLRAVGRSWGRVH
jgi:hypothetical protein